MKIRASTYFLVFLLLLLAFIIGVSSGFHAFQAKFLFLLLGGVAFVLGGVELARELRASGKTEAASTESRQAKRSAIRPGEIRTFLSSVAWTVGFFTGILLVGFYISIILWMFLFLKLHKVSWVTTVSCIVGTLIVVYLIFAVGLEVELYPGWLFNLFQ